MSIFVTVRDDIEYPFEQAWAHIKPVLVDDVEPALKSFLQLFASQEGKLILTLALQAAPALLTGNFGVLSGQLVSDAIAQSVVLAKQDAAVTLQQVQSALQIAKVAQNIATPADTAIVAAIPPVAA